MWLLLLFSVFVTSVAAQQDSPADDAKALLVQVRKKLMLTVNRLPRYMCTETIDRSTFRPKTKLKGVFCDDLAVLRKKTDWRVRENTSDRLRLDVAVSGRLEMYSWAGEGRFQDRSLADLVQRGATSTGAFVSFLSAIFGNDAANFTYNGDVSAGGRALVEFSFRVPLDKSDYRLESTVHGAIVFSAIVAYDGTFLVDPKTFDLVRLTVRVDRIPPELNVCEDITTLNYGSVRLNNAEFFLPKDVRFQAINADGSELENRTVFSGCHEFHSESSLSFDTETEHGPPQNAEVRALALPPGLPFTLALTQAIETATAAAGDRIKAKLTSPIKEKHNNVLIPKGAAVTGRIVQIERHYGGEFESLTLAFKLETVEANGVPQPFAVRLESAVRSSKSVDSLEMRQDLGSFGQMFDREDPGVGFLEFQDVSRNFLINRGVKIEGITAPK